MTGTGTILVATLGERSSRFERLMWTLLPQLGALEGHPIRVLAYWNNGERPLSEYRQALVDAADSDYVWFADDDDELPEFYAARIAERLDGVDQVGWRMQCVMNGVPLKPTFHSVRYHGWWEDDAGYYRDVSHLNPIRTDIARQADFRRGDPPEDVAWTTQIRGFVVTEHFIDDCMYVYHSSSHDSRWHPGSVPTGVWTRPDIRSPLFSYHPDSEKSS